MKIYSPKTTYTGYFAYHRQLKELIEEEGFLFSEEYPPCDYEDGWTPRDYIEFSWRIVVLHVPTGKVSTTVMQTLNAKLHIRYFKLKKGSTHWGKVKYEKVENDINEFMWILAKDNKVEAAKAAGKFTDAKQ